MRWADIRHQPRAGSIIRRALASGRVHHAYLFEGPQGVGKESAARGLAARLLCQSPAPPGQVDACGTCASCRLLERDAHPDFHLIHRGLHRFHPDPAVRRSRGLFLSVDLVRHFLIARAGLKPALGRARVFLILQAERMNDAAQNALLKTLEEPPGDTRLILVTTSAGRLLPTIRSRCQIVPFAPLPPGFVAEQIARIARADAGQAHCLARLCDGRLGAALDWHRMGLLDALEPIAACLDALRGDDPEGFGKSLVQIAESLGRRQSELAADREAEAAGRSRAREEGADEAAGPEAATDADADAPAEAPEPRDAGADEPPAMRSPAARGTATDELRGGLRLVLMLIAALFRDALLIRSRAAPELFALPQCRALSARLAAEEFTVEPEDCIQAVVEAEAMIERNVSPQLACERLAAALKGLIVPAV